MKILCPETKSEKGSVPVEDLGLLMLDHFQITVSHQLIQRLMGNNVVVISCDAFHLPHGIMLPMHGHTEHSARIKYQIEASEPLKKQLWKQTVECKIENQKEVLKRLGNYYEPMLEYQKNVKSGDVTNMEGIAAQHYWKYLISLDFLRQRFGDSPNQSSISATRSCGVLLQGLWWKQACCPFWGFSIKINITRTAWRTM